MAKTTLCYYLLKSNCLLRYTYVPGQSLFSPFPFGEQKIFGNKINVYVISFVFTIAHTAVLHSYANQSH